LFISTTVLSLISLQNSATRHLSSDTLHPDPRPNVISVPQNLHRQDVSYVLRVVTKEAWSTIVPREFSRRNTNASLHVKDLYIAIAHVDQRYNVRMALAVPTRLSWWLRRSPWSLGIEPVSISIYATKAAIAGAMYKQINFFRHSHRKDNRKLLEHELNVDKIVRRRRLRMNEAYQSPIKWDSVIKTFPRALSLVPPVLIGRFWILYLIHSSSCPITVFSPRRRHRW
jgi:hypothetical protein